MARHAENGREYQLELTLQNEEQNGTVTAGEQRAECARSGARNRISRRASIPPATDATAVRSRHRSGGTRVDPGDTLRVLQVRQPDEREEKRTTRAGAVAAHGFG